MVRRGAGTMLALLALALPVAACGQTPVHAPTDTPESARYQIVQSSIVARSTFRLDRFTGATDVLTMGADSAFVWEEVRRQVHPLRDTALPNRPNYSLFLSGIANRYTFLLNVNTGATWVLTRMQSGDVQWDAMQ